MEFSELLDKYLTGIEKLATLSGQTENIEKTKVDLVNAAYLNFAAIAGEDPGIKPLLGSTEGTQLSLEEFQAKVNDLQSAMQIANFDFAGNFRKAMKQTLEDYISELGKLLSPEKTAGLEAVIRDF